MREKLFHFMKNQKYQNRYFFYNHIKEMKNNRRSAFIKNQFENILN
jgi:hypothetical protein